MWVAVISLPALLFVLVVRARSSRPAEARPVRYEPHDRVVVDNVVFLDAYRDSPPERGDGRSGQRVAAVGFARGPTGAVRPGLTAAGARACGGATQAHS